MVFADMALPYAMQKSSQDLADLMQRVARQDRAAFAALYRATSAKLFGVILRILRRRDLADEVLQEVYVRIWQHAGRFDGTRASAVTWMAAIARNAALDAVRMRTHVSMDDAPEALEVRDPGPLAPELLELGEDIDRLRRCIGDLEPERQQIVRLAYLDGLSREELSQRFGHPVPTIKTWLHRSLKRLKDCLDQ